MYVALIFSFFYCKFTLITLSLIIHVFQGGSAGMGFPFVCSELIIIVGEELL